jgi:hypothetical protein
MIDLYLDTALFGHFFGRGVERLERARRTRRYRTLRLILQSMYIMQKLSIVRSFRTIPRPIVHSIAAINDLRNGLAHTFFVSELSANKRTYKGHNIFTRKGMLTFQNDTEEIEFFFMPWLKKLLVEEGERAEGSQKMS